MPCAKLTGLVWKAMGNQMSSGTGHLRVSLGEMADSLSELETRGFTCTKTRRIFCSRNRVKGRRIDASMVCEFRVMVRDSEAKKKKQQKVQRFVGG